VIDILCWHQGEAESNLTDMSSQAYRDCFLTIVDAV
jgi:hypothetical protein